MINLEHSNRHGKKSQQKETPMWNCEVKELTRNRVTYYRPLRNGRPVSFREVSLLWIESSEFRQFFIDLLAGSPFTGFRWETPPVSAASFDREFEFVLLSAPGLERPVDQHAFASHFAFQFASAEEPGGREEDDGHSASGAVADFKNLSGDAHLIVPCPDRPLSSGDIPGPYGHLAAFVRRASSPQLHRLWIVVGRVLQDRINDHPVWLSTAGMGVSWLHVRLDSRPKYYGYAPYKNHDSGCDV